MLQTVRSRTSLRVTTTSVLLAALTCIGGVGAALADDLNLGGNYTYNIVGTFMGATNQSYGGGSINTSYLNGRQLPFVFCVDIGDDVGVPADYANTAVATNGMAMHQGVVQKIANAGQIAYLLDHYGFAATTSDQLAGLQGAIWHLAYLSDNATASAIVGANPGGYDLTDTAGARLTDYTAYLNDVTNNGTTVNSDPVSSLLWFSPHQNANQSDIRQGLITAAVPEPAYYQMAAFVVLGGASLLRLRRKTAV